MKKYLVSVYQYVGQHLFFSQSFLIRCCTLLLLLHVGMIGNSAYSQCVNTPKLTSNGATFASVYKGTSGLLLGCIGCSISNENNLLDADLTNFASISLGIGIANAGYIKIKMGQTYPSGTRAGFVADVNGGLVGLLNGVSLVPYLNGVAGSSISTGNLINILGFGGGTNISAVFCQPFDEIRISVSSFASVGADYKIYYAYVATGCSFPVQCSSQAAVAEICGNGIDDDGDGLVDSEDSDCTPASFTFNCGTATTTGSFIANGTSQSGTLTVPMTGTTAGLVTLTVSGNGFSGSYTTHVTAGQTSVTFPITYDGSGTGGSPSLTVTSAQATGACTKAVTVAAPPVAGTIDCSKTEIYEAPVVGTASQLDLVVTLNVTSKGTFTPVTITGSGMAIANGVASVITTTTGIQKVHIPIKYDGTALTNNLQFTIGTAGSCTADMTKSSKVVSKNVYSLDGCTAIIPGTLTK